MEVSFTPMYEAKHARCSLLVIQMIELVAVYIRWFCALMYKVPVMTQEEAFLLFIQGLKPKIQEKIGFHVEGNLGRAMVMAEKVDLWRTKAKGD